MSRDSLDEFLDKDPHSYSQIIARIAARVEAANVASHESMYQAEVRAMMCSSVALQNALVKSLHKT